MTTVVEEGSYAKTATSTASAAKSKYRPEIDGLRAFAVAAVIVNHLSKDLLPSGYLGVDIFFVISGYVITSSLAERKSSSFQDFVTSFYERRIKRLFPALVVFVMITTVLICLFNPDPGVALNTGISSLFGFSNLYLLKASTDYFAQSTELNPLVHTWSLGVEEQFYLLFPCLIWFSGFGRQAAKGARNLFVLVTALTSASLIFFIYLHQDSQAAAYFLMPPRFWEMAAGCLIFVGFQKRARIEQALERVPPLLIVTAILGVMFLPVGAAVPATVGIVLLSAILIACLKEGTAAHKLFTHGKIVYIGLISYSLYLWHWAVLSISRWTIGIHLWTIPIQIVLMLALAIASYEFIEVPFRSYPCKSRNIIFIVGAMLAASSILMIRLAGKYSGRLYLGKEDTLATSKEVFGSTLSGSLPRSKCYTKSLDSIHCSLSSIGNMPLSRITIFLAGDSHALALNPLLEFLNVSAGARVVSTSVGSTAFPGINSGASTRQDRERRVGLQNEIEESVFARLKREDVLLISNVMPDYLSSDGDYRAYRNRLFGVARKANKIGARIFLFSPIPRYPAISNGAACTNQWFQLGCSIKLDHLNDRSSLASELYLSNRLYEDVRAKYPRTVFVFNTFDFLCPEKLEYCPLKMSKGDWIFYDNTHINSSIARKIAGRLLPRLLLLYT